jgi:deoxycytidine triphosphate deaminase
VNNDTVLACGPLPDWRIRELCRQDPPLIAPFDEAALNPFGYDVALSNEFWRLRDDWQVPLDPYNPPPDEAWHKFDLDLRKNNSVIVYPGELWLAFTVEIFHLPFNIEALMLNRSKYARCEASPNCGVAPIDSGFLGGIVLELIAHVRPVVYEVGRRIAQIMFLAGAECEQPYSADGHVYQAQYKIRGPEAK